MMHIPNNFYIRCDKCGSVTLIEADSLDYETSVYDRSMGEEIEYDFRGEIFGRGTILKNDEVPNYERFLPKEEYIKEDNHFSPLGVEGLYLAIGNDNDIHECAQAECRVKTGNRFGFCHFQFDGKYDDYKLVDLTITDGISYAELNASLKEYRQAQVKKGVEIAKVLGFIPKMSTDKKEFADLFTRWGYNVPHRVDKFKSSYPKIGQVKVPVPNEMDR